MNPPAAVAALPADVKTRLTNLLRGLLTRRPGRTASRHVDDRRASRESANRRRLTSRHRAAPHRGKYRTFWYHRPPHRVAFRGGIKKGVTDFAWHSSGRGARRCRIRKIACRWSLAVAPWPRPAGRLQRPGAGRAEDLEPVLDPRRRSTRGTNIAPSDRRCRAASRTPCSTRGAAGSRAPRGPARASRTRCRPRSSPTEVWVNYYDARLASTAVRPGARRGQTLSPGRAAHHRRRAGSTFYSPFWQVHLAVVGDVPRRSLHVDEAAARFRRRRSSPRA